MAAETTLTSHQRSYERLKSYVDNGYGIAVGEYTRADGTRMMRYVVPYNADGEPIRRSDLKRALGDDPTTSRRIQQINDLAQSIMDSHRKSHDTTDEHKTQAAFYNRDGIHYVKSDQTDREDTHGHKTQSLKTPEHTSYVDAHGGVVEYDDPDTRNKFQVTAEQKEVLDFGPTLDGKEAGADVSRELKELKDKKFVRIFRKVQQDNPSKTPSAIYTEALQKYTSDTVKAFQVSLHLDTKPDVGKSLQKTAHKIAEPGVAEEDLSETWLEDNLADFGTPNTAGAVFQAVQEVGAKEVGVDPDKHTQTTADHAYQALLSKVNEYWIETNRDTSIHTVDFLGVPIGGAAPLHGEPPRHVDEPHGTTLVKAKDVLPLIDTNEELRMLEGELRDLTDLKARYNSAVEKYFNSISVIPFRTDVVARDEANREWCTVAREVAERWAVPDYDETETDLFAYTDPVGRFISSKIPELEEKIALQKEKADFYRSPNGFIRDLESLRQQRTAKAEELTHAWRGPLGSKGTIQKEIEILDSQIAAKKAVLKEWETPKGRVELLTIYLHQGTSTEPKAEDYISLCNKVSRDSYTYAELTPGEIGALQKWKLPESFDPSTSQPSELISRLMTHLVQSQMTIALEGMGTRITDVDTDSGEYPTWRDNQRIRDFINGAKFLELVKEPAELGNRENKEALFALRLAHDAAIDAEPSLTIGTEVWKTAMLKSLREEAFKAITPELENSATSLGTDMVTIRSTNPEPRALHYLHINEYLQGQARDLTSEEIYALDKLIATANTVEDHQKLEFLQQQAWQHYTHLRMEEETQGQNLDLWTPTENDLRGAMEWLTDPTDPVRKDEVKKALLLVKPDSASGVGQVHAKLDQAIRIAKLEASGEDPSGYDYTAEDVLAVHAYLGGNGPELAGNQVKAFKKMQAGAPPTYKEKLTYYPNLAERLKQAARIAELEGSDVDPSGYEYQPEDLMAVHDHLEGSEASLTQEQIKAFKKMQADGHLPPAFEDRPAHYKNKVLTSIPLATANKYSGRLVNWEHVWDHAEAELTDFDPSTIDTSSISKATYNSAKTKLTTTPLATLSPAEKYVVYRQHKFITENKESDIKQLKGFFLLVLLERHTPSA